MNYSFRIIREMTLMYLIRLRMLHVYEKEWYKGEYRRSYIHEYYQEVRKIMKTVPSKYWELTRCADCGIYFLTSCSNRGRKDIRCPFGCREKHKKKASKNRSTAYYQTDHGKIKRRIQNVKRDRRSSKRPAGDGKEKPSSEEKNGSFVGHVRFIVSLIEGRFISWQEIKDILLEYFKKWRQLPLEYWLKLCNMTA